MMTVDQLVTAINASTSKFKSELIALVLGASFMDAKYMKTVTTGIGGAYISGAANLGRVVQGFKAEFQPLGDITITPTPIVPRRHKINVKITPDELYGAWTAFLLDESKKPEDQPITKYILEELLKPAILRDREDLLANGVFDNTKQAQFGYSMDGYLKQLTDGVGNTGRMYKVPISVGAPTANNIVDYFEELTDKLPIDVRKVKGSIKCDPDLITMYMRKDRELNGQNPTYTAEDLRIFGTNKSLVGLDGMVGSKKAFFTPDRNFIRIINMNDGATRFNVIPDHYSVEFSADWHESVGFDVPEYVFVPTDGTVNPSAGLSAGRTSTYFPQ